jgi:hypothetical protein
MASRLRLERRGCGHGVVSGSVRPACRGGWRMPGGCLEDVLRDNDGHQRSTAVFPDLGYDQSHGQNSVRLTLCARYIGAEARK